MAATAMIAAYNRGEMGGPARGAAGPVPGRYYVGEPGPEIVEGGPRG
jgi:hypothetical protein